MVTPETLMNYDPDDTDTFSAPRRVALKASNNSSTDLQKLSQPPYASNRTTRQQHTPEDNGHKRRTPASKSPSIPSSSPKLSNQTRKPSFSQGSPSLPSRQGSNPKISPALPTRRSTPPMAITSRSVTPPLAMGTPSRPFRYSTDTFSAETERMSSSPALELSEAERNSVVMAIQQQIDWTLVSRISEVPFERLMKWWLQKSTELVRRG